MLWLQRFRVYQPKRKNRQKGWVYGLARELEALDGVGVGIWSWDSVGSLRERSAANFGSRLLSFWFWCDRSVEFLRIRTQPQKFWCSFHRQKNTLKLGALYHIYTGLKAHVDLGDQTAEFIPFEVTRTAILTVFYLFLGINIRILISVINTRFQPDAPVWCIIESIVR